MSNQRSITRLRGCLVFFVWLGVCACADRPLDRAATGVSSAETANNLLANPGFENGDPAFTPWLTIVHAHPEAFDFKLDSGIFRDGASSMRIERMQPEPFAQVAQHFRRRDLPAETRYRLVAWVRGEGLSSPAYLHATFYDHGSALDEAGRPEDGLSGTFDWTRLERIVTMPERASAVRVGVVSTGDGILWIDSAEFVPFPD